MKDNLISENKENELNYLNTDEYKKSRKKDVRKTILASLLYLFIFLILANIILSFNPPIGVGHVLIVSLSIIPVYYFIGKNKNLTSVKRKFGFKEFIFFAGLILIITIFFSKLTEILMNIFNFTSRDVTNEINHNLTPDVIFYVVLFGPFMEELQYRGFYVNNLRKHGAIVSIFLTAIIFSFSHMNFIQGFGTLGIGLILSYVTYTYSFRASVLLHIWNNLMVILTGIAMKLSPNLNTPHISFIILNTIILILLISSILLFFNKNIRKPFKETLKLTNHEKDSIKYLFTDIFVIIYIIFIIALNIIFGEIAN